MDIGINILLFDRGQIYKLVSGNIEDRGQIFKNAAAIKIIVERLDFWTELEKIGIDKISFDLFRIILNGLIKKQKIIEVDLDSVLNQNNIVTDRDGTINRLLIIHIW